MLEAIDCSRLVNAQPRPLASLLMVPPLKRDRGRLHSFSDGRRLDQQAAMLQHVSLVSAASSAQSHARMINHRARVLAGEGTGRLQLWLVERATLL